MSRRRWARSFRSGFRHSGRGSAMTGFRVGSPSARTSAGGRHGRTQRSAVDRLACVSLAAFPLQLLLRRHPEWVAHPVTVVAEDRPQGLILWVNEAARRAGVLSGLRYAAGCSLTAELRAGGVPPAEIAEVVAALTERLGGLPPEGEPASQHARPLWVC